MGLKERQGVDVTMMVSAGELTRKSPNGVFTATVLLLLACLFTGCVVTEQSRTGKQGEEPNSGNLVKPYIPEGRNESVPENPVPSTEPAPMEPVGASPEPVQSATLPKGEDPRRLPPSSANEDPTRTEPQKKTDAAQSKTVLWEDQKVKSAAVEMMKQFPSARKVKICYAVKDDEWWVIIYDDLGSHYELRQFTWDRDQARLQPFLVLKRIDKNEFSEHIAASEPDRACEVLDPALPKEGSPGNRAGS